MCQETNKIKFIRKKGAVLRYFPGGKSQCQNIGERNFVGTESRAILVNSDFFLVCKLGKESLIMFHLNFKKSVAH